MSRQNRDQRPVRLPYDSLAYAMRQAAMLVDAVLGGRNLTEAWDEHLEKHPDWADGTRGAVRDLTWSTLRAGPRGDAVLDVLLSKPLPGEVRALLLVALQRIDVRPEQAHTVVDQAVEATNAFAPGLKGVVNGVLRNRLRRQDEFAKLIEQSEAARFAHPEWWITRVKQDHPDAWRDVLEAGNTRPPMSLRVNRRKLTPEQYLQELQQHGVEASPIGEDGLLLDEAVGVSRLPQFEEGGVSIQDAGAQIAARMLGAKKGERVLDACAAPGGKTAHILELADVEMTALDIDAMRLRRVRDTLTRLGLQATVKVGDAAKVDKWWDGVPFDRILADVPCSASGVVRRHPDIKWLRRDDDIRRFALQQSRILDALWRTLAPGGTMLYATCSVFDEENGAQIARFRDRHPDMENLSPDDRNEFQLLPNAENDGFYYALLRKRH